MLAVQGDVLALPGCVCVCVWVCVFACMCGRSRESRNVRVCVCVYMIVCVSASICFFPVVVLYNFALIFNGLGSLVLVSSIMSVSIPIPAHALRMLVMHLCCFMRALTTGVPSGTTGALSM